MLVGCTADDVAQLLLKISRQQAEVIEHQDFPSVMIDSRQLTGSFSIEPKRFPSMQQHACRRRLPKSTRGADKYDAVLLQRFIKLGFKRRFKN